MKSLYAIKPGASGDITPPEGQRSTEFIAWWDLGIAPYNPTTLVHDEKLYVLYDRGPLSCFDVKAGQPFYITSAIQAVSRDPKTSPLHRTAPLCVPCSFAPKSPPRMPAFNALTETTTAKFPRRNSEPCASSAPQTGGLDRPH